MADVTVKFPRPTGLSNQGWGVLQNGALDLARSLTPVDTGVLRDGWDDGASSAREVQLVNPTEYAGYVDEGTPKMAPRGYSSKIYDQLSALAGRLMEQFPAATGGTNRGSQASQEFIGGEAAKEAEFTKKAALQGQFSKLGAGVGGAGRGDFGSAISVNHPIVQAEIGHLTGAPRQTAYLKYLAGAHKVPR